MDAPTPAAPSAAKNPRVTNVALKEWAVVVKALEEGRQILLLRKGGIREEGGEFRVEHTRFFLFPTYEHQDAKMLKPLFWQDLRETRDESFNATVIPLTAFAEVTDVLKPASPAAFEPIADRHVWTPALVRMRFDYMPEKPLYALLARVFRLPKLVVLSQHQDYAGCRSWVPMKEAFSAEGALPVLADADYESERQAIRKAIG